MYPGKVSYSILPTKHNLKNAVLETKNSTRHLRYSLTVQYFSVLESCSNLRSIRNQLFKLIEQGQALKSFRESLLSMSESLKSQSSSILRMWTRQCECVVAQRLRRGQQMFCLYSKLWEEHALREFLNRMRQQVTRRSKEFMLTAVGITAYNWNENRILDDEIKEHVHELEYMHILKDQTMICQICRNINRNDKTTLYCNCPNRKNVYLSFDNWSVFLEKKDMVVWRRMHKSGGYEYKVYGSFHDVCADDFLNVQIDIDYRRQWDTTAVTLNVVEKDPNISLNSDIVYWEMYWPYLFINRDYVFKRRYMVDVERKTLLLVSKCTEHPNCPIVSDKYRVSDYYSHMVIKPYTKFSEPGLEFGLTYYDNPGINIPAAVSAWVAYRAMPEFLCKLRTAAQDYQNYCNKNGLRKLCCLKTYDEQSFQMLLNEKIELNEEKMEDGLTINTEPESTNVKVQEPTAEKIPGAEIMTSPIISAEPNNRNYWKYFQPTYYFG